MIDLVRLPYQQWFCCDDDARPPHTGAQFTVKRNTEYIVLKCCECGAEYAVWTGK